MFRIGSLADAKKKADDTAAKQVYGKMNEEEKKAFVRRMKKGKKDAAKGKSKSKGGGKSNKYWDKIYHLTFKGEKIPYQITKGKK